MPRPRATSLTTIGAAAIGIFAAGSIGAGETDYLRDVKPIFIEKCSSCHGPARQEASLRLDAAPSIRQGGESGPAATPGDVAASLLYDRVTAEDAAQRMPPEGEGEPLTAEQLSHLSAWIASGMPAPEDDAPLPHPSDHWAYRPPTKIDVPAGANPIDVAIDAKLAAAGLEPLPPADRATLLRRLHYDLIGLPPTPEELRAFLADDSEGAFDRAVDRLLEDPRYGERWARHWMDVWRYSDWDGYGEELRGGARHIWHWRDWIVRSLNQGKPYDRMVAEMLAGDELAPTDPNVLAATGFLARNFHNLNRDVWLDATAEHSAKAFLGTTIACARCHDHKFDPLPQTEYYAWRAIFEPHRIRTDRVPGQLDVAKDGVPRAYDADLEVATYLYARGDEKHPVKDHPIAPAVPAIFASTLAVESVALPSIAAFPALSESIEQESLAQIEGARAVAQEKFDQAKATHEATLTADTEAALKQAELTLAAATAEVESLRARWAADRAKHDTERAVDAAEIERLAKLASAAERRLAAAKAELELSAKTGAVATAAASQEPDEKKRTEALEKAKNELVAAQKTREEAVAKLEGEDANYTSVGEAYPRASSGRRLALARWIGSPDNPLAARVAVNHVWMRHFGEPLVENVFDFGIRTPRPVQAEALDTLAVELVESGWDLKSLHRRIVTSNAWRRSSSAKPDVLAPNASVDPDNKLYWRANVRRLEAEAVRDGLLHLAGAIDATQGGPDIEASQGETVYRRSLYFRHAREKQMKMLTLFDAASPDDCYRRAESVVPQQALALANGDLARSMSRRLARQLSGPAESPIADAQFVALAFETTLCRQPTAEEAEASLRFLERQTAALANTAELSPIEGPVDPTTAAASDPAQRARESLVHVLFNHNDFVTLR